MKNASLKSFWDSFPLISSLVIAATILMYLGHVVDPNRGSSNSFFDLMTPTLSQLRNGQYWGLLTSSLIDTNPLFIAWGAGWFWHFGHTFENRVNSFFYLFVVISSIVFPELFEILLFETTGHGSGGIISGLFGFVWLMSMYDSSNGWVVTNTQKLTFLAFIVLCIFLDATGIYHSGIGGVIGGLFWGVFVAAVSRSRKSRALRIAIPALVLGTFLVPIFWAPWQNSWLLIKAEQHEKRNDFAEALELYSRVLKNDPQNDEGKEGLVSVYRKHFNAGRYDEAKKPLFRILDIKPDDQDTKNQLKYVELIQAYFKYNNEENLDQAKDSLKKILDLYPDDEWAKETLTTIEEKQ